MGRFSGYLQHFDWASSQDVRVQGHFKLQSELTLKTLALGITT